MAWRLHDFIHLDLTNTKLSDLKFCENPLKKLDNILDYDNNERLITFSPQTQVIMDAFDEIVRKDNKYVTTFKQVKEFVELCFKKHYEKATDYFDIDEMIACIYEIEVTDDTVVVIEFED
jgi:hypothetical protein